MSPCSVYHETAHAKINLFLHVTGQREDGYHLLDSLVAFTDFGDEVTLESIRPTHCEDLIHYAPALTITGPFSHNLHVRQDNLILRADRLLLEKTLQAQLELETINDYTFTLVKNLPVSSGIGGGSADAAAALRLLARRRQEIAPLILDIAPQLGADVPVCLQQRPARMEGIGEILSPVPTLPPIGIMLVNPGISVSTPSIFKALDDSGGVPSRSRPNFPTNGWKNYADLIAFLETTTNDLQPPAIAAEPVIAEVLDYMVALPDAKLTRMSGSGATCFTLFEDIETAKRAESYLKAQPYAQKWWIRSGGLKA